MKIIAPIAMLLAVGAYADNDDRVDMDVKTSVQYFYDSAVGIDEINQSSFASDKGTRLNVTPSVSFKASDSTTLLASYNRTLSHFETLDEYNLDIADTTLAVQQNTALGKLGYRYDYVDAEVDDSAFLRMELHTLDWGNMLSDSLYWRLAYQHKDKTFDELAGRNARNDAASSEWYYFFNQQQSSLLMGLGYEEERADSDQYSNQVMAYKLGVNHQLQWLGKPSTIKVLTRYRQAEYDAGRRDNIYSVDASFTRAVTEHFSLVTAMEYSDRQSTLLSADYDRLIVRAGVDYRF